LAPWVARRTKNMPREMATSKRAVITLRQVRPMEVLDLFGQLVRGMNINAADRAQIMSWGKLGAKAQVLLLLLLLLLLLRVLDA